MRLIDYALLALVGAILFFAIRSRVKRRASGAACGCGGCSGCASRGYNRADSAASSVQSAANRVDLGASQI